MVHVSHLAAALAAGYLGALLLTRSRWTWRSPRSAIVCWQLLGLALGLCAIGLPLEIGLAPYRAAVGPALVAFARDLRAGALPPGMTAWRGALVLVGLLVGVRLVAATVTHLVHTLRARRRHRDLLALVARADPAAPGALVLDHPSAAAYCLPGMRSTVVVSAGTLSLLDREQLAAVLSHERAHGRERHDLVVLPFGALCRVLPFAGWLHAARDAVSLLVEMRADDRARQAHTDGPLAGALLRFATASATPTPAGALGAAEHLEARMDRLVISRRRRPPRVRAALALAATAVLAATPLITFLS
ncbi:M56 family metallopeptidase [Rhizomonospora bruguierae]|uniref:M56 family metallopeptidase n=1 Tax=Rhizomonospora bruguierae TaxID=1581705 RepID=UPI001BCFCBB2|nr:M56 family metallopeptidase [Micromonospora sp. NBRC 107566]